MDTEIFPFPRAPVFPGFPRARSGSQSACLRTNPYPSVLIRTTPPRGQISRSGGSSFAGIAPSKTLMVPGTGVDKERSDEVPERSEGNPPTCEQSRFLRCKKRSEAKAETPRTNKICRSGGSPFAGIAPSKTLMVPGTGVEPVRLAAQDFKSRVSAISPPGRRHNIAWGEKKIKVRCANSPGKPDGAQENGQEPGVFPAASNNFRFFCSSCFIFRKMIVYLHQAAIFCFYIDDFDAPGSIFRERRRRKAVRSGNGGAKLRHPGGGNRDR